MAEVQIEINGKQYRMACEKGEEDFVQSLGERFNSCVMELKEKFGQIDDGRLMIMAAMIITDQLVESEKLVARCNSEIARLRQEGEEKRVEFENKKQELAITIDNAAEKIEAIAGGLNQKEQKEK